MTTNVALINDSLRLLGVLGETESASAEQGALGLRVLNRMMEQWSENDIELGWFKQSATTDTAPIPEWTEQGVVSKLAAALRPYYPASTLEPWVLDDAMNGYGTIARRSALDRLKSANMNHLPQGEGFYGVRSRIETDN